MFLDKEGHKMPKGLRKKICHIFILNFLLFYQTVSGKPITIFFNLSSINISSISNIEYANISIYVKKVFDVCLMVLNVIYNVDL